MRSHLCKSLTFVEEYGNQTKLYVDINGMTILALFSKTLLQITHWWFLTISIAILEIS